LTAIVDGVTIRSQVLALGSSRHQHHNESRIEAIRVWILLVSVGEEVEYQVSRLVQVLKDHMNVEIMVVVGSKNSQKGGRGVQVLLAVDCLEETPLGKRGYGLRSMVIEPADFEVVLNQTSCSREVVVHGQVCD
jgi:hypothetical protein